MDTNKAQLRKDFYAQISNIQSTAHLQTMSTLALLTEEELHELESLWIEHAVWKTTQNC
ncbi:hypothetical protein [Vibrio atypicus]|uniref:hypothetical protein n=1 Tax=Vibrio atypicus TaxID=558271 RepID=UPI0037353746